MMSLLEQTDVLPNMLSLPELFCIGTCWVEQMLQQTEC